MTIAHEKLNFYLTILFVDDLPEAVRFYDEAFGWEKKADFPIYVSYDTGRGLGISLYDREACAMNLGRTPTLTPRGEISGTELYIQCADLEDAIQKVESAGGRLVSPLRERNWGDEVAYYADPAGNVLALARPLRSEG